MGTHRYDLNKNDDRKRATQEVGRLRKILDDRDEFRCEDLDTITWNSLSFRRAVGGRFISGSTYVHDGRLELFETALGELEAKLR
jgi:hypothetical protein